MDEEKDDELWTTKDLRRIPIKELTDEHLLNVLRLLERKHAWVLLQYVGSDDSMLGEHAADAKNEEFDRLMEFGPAASDGRYANLLAEALRRCLTNTAQRHEYREQMELAVMSLALGKIR